MFTVNCFAVRRRPRRIRDTLVCRKRCCCARMILLAQRHALRPRHYAQNGSCFREVPGWQPPNGSPGSTAGISQLNIVNNKFPAYPSLKHSPGTQLAKDGRCCR